MLICRTTGEGHNVTIQMIYNVHKIMDHICGLMINIKNSPKSSIPYKYVHIMCTLT